MILSLYLGGLEFSSIKEFASKYLEQSRAAEQFQRLDFYTVEV